MTTLAEKLKGLKGLEGFIGILAFGEGGSVIAAVEVLHVNDSGDLLCAHLDVPQNEGSISLLPGAELAVVLPFDTEEECLEMFGQMKGDKL